MPIRRRPNGSWLIDFIAADGARVRKTVAGSHSRAEVLSMERGLRAAPTAGRGPSSPIADVIRRYWLEHGQHMASAGSERAYLDCWAAALGDARPVSEVTAGDIAAAIASWRGQISDSTVNRRRACLQRLWGRAEDIWGWQLQRIPWRRLRLAEPEPRDRSLSDETVERLLDALPERSRVLVEFLLATGLRRGAVLKLTRADVDMKAGVIRAISKGRAGGKVTPVPITTTVRSILRRLDMPEVGSLFGITKQQLRKDWERARVASGIPGARLHDCRHTFAQRLEDAGLGDAIQAALHHSDPRLRLRYAHARPEMVRAAVEKATSGHTKGTRRS